MAKASAASLSILPSVREYEPAPVTLGKAAAKVWNTVIRTKPQEWFGPDTYPLLETYCSLVIEHKAVLILVNHLTGEGLDVAGVARLQELSKLLQGQRASLAMLATKMRLSQQSKYGARQAAEGKNRQAPTANKPWERTA